MDIKYIRVCSDLHLEGFVSRAPALLALDFVPPDDRDAESMLVLAGDISSSPDQLIEFLTIVLPRFAQVLYVPGNHEYYKHHFHQWNIDMEKSLQPLVNDGLMFSTEGISVSERSGCRFIYGTMWGDGGPTLQDQAKTGFYLNDFRLIRAGDVQGFVRFTVQDMITQYKMAKRAISNALEMPFDGKTVVITHHLPSRRLVSPRFWPGDGSDGANGGFVGNCDDILAKTETAPALWIHGHTHDSIDTELWKTRIVCNPAGYRGEWASQFNTYMVREQREDGSFRAIVAPKFIALSEL